MADTNPYRVWIAEYAGDAYQEVAADATASLDALATRTRVLAGEPWRERRLAWLDPHALQGVRIGVREAG